jgi:Ca2+-binding RTX toxin-like protein
MVQHIWTFLESEPVFNPEETLDAVMVFGFGTGADAHHVRLADAAGDRVVFTGSFAFSGGTLTGGTVTGFDVFTGSTKVLHATGYDVSYVTLANAIAAYQADSSDPTLGMLLDHGTKYLGSSGADRILSEALTGGGHNVLQGGAGNDDLYAAPGDTLIGGLGKDTFSFAGDFSLGGGNVKIVDFTPGQDIMVLGAVFDALAPGFLTRGEFHIGAKATALHQHVIYNPATGALYYDHDGVGGDPQVLFAHLAPHLNLTAHSFVHDVYA